MESCCSRCQGSIGSLKSRTAREGIIHPAYVRIKLADSSKLGSGNGSFICYGGDQKAHLKRVSLVKSIVLSAQGRCCLRCGKLPGDLHRLWRSTEPKTYHMEYGFSCMGYEVSGAFGAALAEPDREVYADSRGWQLLNASFGIGDKLSRTDRKSRFCCSIIMASNAFIICSAVMEAKASAMNSVIVPGNREADGRLYAD